MRERCWGGVWREWGSGGQFIARRPVHGGHGAGAVQGARGLAIGTVEARQARERVLALARGGAGPVLGEVLYGGYGFGVTQDGGVAMVG